MTTLLIALALGSPLSTRTVSHADQAFRIVAFDPVLARLELVGGAEPLRTFADLRRAGPFLAATNAGIFHPNLRAVGLHVEDGHEHVPLELADGAGNFYLKPNGVFWIDAEGAHVAASEDYAPVGEVQLATQSGPLLLDGGVRHPAFRDDSKNRLLRSGVGVCSGRPVLAISEGAVRFAELAGLFEALGCEDALYLDGVISVLDLGEGPAPEGRFAGFLVVRSTPPADREDEGEYEP